MRKLRQRNLHYHHHHDEDEQDDEEEEEQPPRLRTHTPTTTAALRPVRSRRRRLLRVLSIDDRNSGFQFLAAGSVLAVPNGGRLAVHAKDLGTAQHKLFQLGPGKYMLK
jgi:hypothetical protein